MGQLRQRREMGRRVGSENTAKQKTANTNFCKKTSTH